MEYKKFKVRLKRDNPKICGCDVCQNPRKKFSGKNFLKLSLKEKIMLDKFKHDLKCEMIF